MSRGLEAPLAAYFEASNAHDSESLLTAFTEGSVARDETQEMVGLAAVRDWAHRAKGRHLAATALVLRNAMMRDRSSRGGRPNRGARGAAVRGRD